MLKKSKNDNAVLFVDGSAEFVRLGNKNKLTDENRQRILDAFQERKDVAHFARLVESDELTENGFNLSVSSYVEAYDTREAVDIVALNREIAKIVELGNKLRSEVDLIVLDIEGQP